MELIFIFVFLDAADLRTTRQPDRSGNCVQALPLRRRCGCLLCHMQDCERASGESARPDSKVLAGVLANEPVTTACSGVCGGARSSGVLPDVQSAADVSRGPPRIQHRLGSPQRWRCSRGKSVSFR